VPCVGTDWYPGARVEADAAVGCSPRVLHRVVHPMKFLDVTTTTHDLQIEPESVRVTAFFAATQDVLAALGGGADLAATSQVTRYRGGAWERITPEEIDGAFLACVEFAMRGIVGRFVFGDRESSMSLTLAPTRAPTRAPRTAYHLGEWVVALGSESAPDATFAWLLTARRVQEAVARFGTLLLSHVDRIADAKSETLAQMDAARRLRLESEAAYWRARDQERDEYAAAAAFREGNWRRVIEILSAYEAQLSAAQTMKLTLARKRAGALPES